MGSLNVCCKNTALNDFKPTNQFRRSIIDFTHYLYAKHILFQFWQPTGDEKKSASILQQAIEMGAKPWEALEIAVQNLKGGKCQLLSQEDKEDFAGLLFFFFFCF